MEIRGKLLDTLHQIFPVYTGIEIKIAGPGAEPERLYYAVGSRDKSMHFYFSYEAGNTLIKGRFYESRLSAYLAIIRDRFAVRRFSIITKHLNIDVRGVSKRGIVSVAGDTIPEGALKGAEFYFEIKNCFLEGFLATQLGWLVRTKYNDMIQQGDDKIEFNESRPITASEVLRRGVSIR